MSFRVLRRVRAALAILGLLAVGCAPNYVDQPALRPLGADLRWSEAEALEAAPAEEVATALAALFADVDAPRGYSLCEADPRSGECEDPEGGLSALGVGGAVLPLVMDLSGLSVDDVARDGEGWTLTSKFHSRVNGIPPLCARATAQVTINPAGSANIVYDGFYCNWAVIGNVITRFKMSVDRIDPSAQTFGGYYALQFNGTGNAGGSGYYRAIPIETTDS